MQIVSSGDNLHESQSLSSGKIKKSIILLSAEFAQWLVKVKPELRRDILSYLSSG